MPYDRLVKQGRIKAYSAHPREIQQLLQVAARDLEVAIRNLNDTPDWAYSIAYNAVLQAGRALMMSEGYRARGGEQHATVVAFVEEKLGASHVTDIHLFDQMRRKRHRVIYEVAGLISKTEAGQAITFAKEFVYKIAEIIMGHIGLGISDEQVS